MTKKKTKSLGERLREAREQHGPHDALATEIGISSRTLQTIINGIPPVQTRVIESCNRFLNSKEL